jgi:hypothetical protein
VLEFGMGEATGRSVKATRPSRPVRSSVAYSRKPSVRLCDDVANSTTPEGSTRSPQTEARVAEVQGARPMVVTPVTVKPLAPAVAL